MLLLLSNHRYARLYLKPCQEICFTFLLKQGRHGLSMFRQIPIYISIFLALHTGLAYWCGASYIQPISAYISKTDSSADSVADSKVLEQYLQNYYWDNSSVFESAIESATESAKQLHTISVEVLCYLFCTSDPA